VELEGVDWADAMKKAGFEYENCYTSGKYKVGRLLDGRRYRISFQTRNDKIKFFSTIKHIDNSEVSDMILKRSRHQRK